MRLFIGLSIVSIALFSSCTPSAPELKTGMWRGVIELQGQQLPFNFKVEKDSSGGFDVYLKNASEELLLDEVIFKNDSVDFVLHVFDAELRASIKDDSLNGYFILNYRKNYRLPFKAAANQYFRFQTVNDSIAETNFTGKYQVLFTNEKDTTEAIGIISQDGALAQGTFLTPTGDYRFLQGNVNNDTIYLSTFDGNHTYLFRATKKNNTTLVGDYWSGKSYHQSWMGVLNENASIPDAEALTYLKDGYDKIEFSFPDVNGNKISLSDEKYKNKVVILQLLGTWCPNCMDETMFLSPWYNQNKNRGIEILGLAYERKADFSYASERVKKMKDKWNVQYDFAIAGVDDKEAASKTLPALNRVVAFPTTIFIGKDGKVKYIHTGFEGPGTGVYHQQFIDRFNQIVNELLNENLASTNIKSRQAIN